jgi:uncharacterized membrane protein
VDLREILLLAVRWSHAAAAAALVGGSAFYLLILAPALARGGAAAEVVRTSVDAGFKELTDLALMVFLISGGLLTFERLSSGAATTPYVVVLGVKLFVSVLLYRSALRVRRGRGWDSREARFLVGSGFVVVFLATVLKTLYEGALRP